MILYLTKCPRPDEIYDYSKYINADWLVNSDDCKNEDDNKQKINFIL